MGRSNQTKPAAQPEEPVVEWPLKETAIEQEEEAQDQESENKYPGVGTRAYRQ